MYAYFLWQKERRSRAVAVTELPLLTADGVAQSGIHAVARPGLQGAALPEHFVRIGNDEFTAPELVTRAFEDGRCYRVYFVQLQGRRAIVAAELVESHNL